LVPRCTVDPVFGLVAGPWLAIFLPRASGPGWWPVPGGRCPGPDLVARRAWLSHGAVVDTVFGLVAGSWLAMPRPRAGRPGWYLAVPSITASGWCWPLAGDLPAQGQRAGLVLAPGWRCPGRELVARRAGLSHGAVVDPVFEQVGRPMPGYLAAQG